MAGRPALARLFEIEIANKYQESNFKCKLEVNHQFNTVSRILYYELSLQCMLQCTLVLVTT